MENFFPIHIALKRAPNKFPIQFPLKETEDESHFSSEVIVNEHCIVVVG